MEQTKKKGSAWLATLERVRDRASEGREPPVTRVMVDEVVRLFIEEVVQRANQGERVRVPRLGVFEVKTLKRRTLRFGAADFDVPSRRVLRMRAVKATRGL